MKLAMTQRQLLHQLAPVRTPSRALFAQRPPHLHHHHTRCSGPSPAAQRISIHLPRRFSACPPLFQGEYRRSLFSSARTITILPAAEAQAKPPRRRRRWFSATIMLLVGALTGTFVRFYLSPPASHLAGSPSDLTLKKRIRARAEKLPIVKQLLAEPGWTHHEAYAAFPASTIPNRITSGPLGAASGIGAYQHIFHPPPHSLEPIINVLYFGLSVTGWPGVVHGGLLATILDEHSARAALAETAGKGVLTAKLDVSYVRPTFALGFYVVRARALRDEELGENERGKRDRKIWVDVSLETAQGLECVRGRALFVIPKGMELRGLEKGF